MSLVACGWNHSLFLDENGSVWSCGYNGYGQLGVGDTTQRESYTKVAKLPIIQNVACGWNHSIFIGENGSVWSCGDNQIGQLGLGDTNKRTEPTEIRNLPRMHTVACGRYHSVFVDIEGDVWACGHDWYGQLGLGEGTITRNQPVKIENLPKMKSVACGGSHTIFLDVNGDVWSCGHNQSGQLGRGDTVANISTPGRIQLPKIRAISCGWNFSLFLDEDGNAYITGKMGRNSYGNQPVKLDVMFKIQAIASEKDHCVFLDIKGSVWGLGANEKGQLGLGDTTGRSSLYHSNTLPTIRSISCGGNHSLFVDVDGAIWSCGSNENGQLGLGDLKDRHVPHLANNLPRLGVSKKPPLQNYQVRHIFDSLKNAQTVDLKNQIKVTSLEERIIDNDFVRENIVNGNIPFNDWENIWTPLHCRKDSIYSEIRTLRVLADEQQKKFNEIQKLLSQTQEQLGALENEKEAIEYFDEFFKPIIQVEQELKKSFSTKFGNVHAMDVEDVCLFLNLCSLPEVIDLVKEKQITGEKLMLTSFTSAFGPPGLGITDPLVEYRLKFFTKLLENNLFLANQKLEKSTIWRHLSVSKTIDLLKEYGIALEKAVIEAHHISICQLVYFKVNDYKTFFGIGWEQAANIIQLLKPVRKDFKKFLKQKE